MRREPWWNQLRFRLLAGFVFVLLGNTLYSEYAVRHMLNSELPSVELQSLTLNGARLRAELEQRYAEGGVLTAAILNQSSRFPQLPVRLYNTDGQIIIDNAPADAARSQSSVDQALKGQPVAPAIVSMNEHRYGVQVLPIMNGGRVVGAMEIAQELAPIDQFQRKLQREFATIVLVSLCSLLAFCVYLGARFSQSLDDIRLQTEAIVSGDFDRRIPVQTYDEIGQIAAYLNQMASDLQNLAKTRNEFLSKVSHELRTPLTIAKGFTSMLASGPMLPEQERTVQVIDSQIDDLTRLVNDLLDLSRRRSSAMDLATEPIDCNAFVAEIDEQFRPVLRQQSISFKVDRRAPNTQIKGDRQRLHQVVGNLLGNAARYCRGTIWLALDADESDVVLTIRDNGPGIAPEDQARIFEPFFQARRGPAGRAGLGLAVARELVVAHGGTLDVESEIDVGTIFVIRLPRLIERDDQRVRRAPWLGRYNRRQVPTRQIEAAPVPGSDS